MTTYNTSLTSKPRCRNKHHPTHNGRIVQNMDQTHHHCQGPFPGEADEDGVGPIPPPLQLKNLILRTQNSQNQIAIASAGISRLESQCFLVYERLRIMDVRAECLFFFFQDFERLTEVLGRDIRANDPRMSAGCPSQKLPLLADFSFLKKIPTVSKKTSLHRAHTKGVMQPARFLEGFLEGSLPLGAS